MKRVIAIILLSATTLVAKAQDLTFDETVKYINEKLACCGGNYSTDTLKAKKDGTITWGSQSVNLFDLYEKDESGNGYYFTIEFSQGIRRSSAFGIIEFTISGSETKRFGDFEIEKEQIRVYNALLHLRSLCTKKKDPFD